MEEIEVRMIRVEPRRVAYALGYGQEPEMQAWRAVLEWAKVNGLLADLSACQFFGFNNPDPTPGSPNYGYEQWLVVPPDLQAEGEVKIKDFAGGFYAVTSCTLLDIGQVWQSLVAWCEASEYYMSDGQCLEALLNPQDFITPEGELQLDENRFADFRLDLYLPVSE